jgi:hypothetical protein
MNIAIHWMWTKDVYYDMFGNGGLLGFIWTKFKSEPLEEGQEPLPTVVPPGSTTYYLYVGLALFYIRFTFTKCVSGV